MRKTHTMLLAMLACCTLLAGGARSQPQPVTNSETKVLEMNSVPDGNFLAKLHFDGEQRRLNFQVLDNMAKCVNTDDDRLKALRGRFHLIGNGVFIVIFQNEHHLATQFWVFQKDGSAIIKEAPDRGEKQTAVPIQGAALELPRK